MDFLKAQTSARLRCQLVEARREEDGVGVEGDVECSCQTSEHKLWPVGEDVGHLVA